MSDSLYLYLSGPSKQDPLSYNNIYFTKDKVEVYKMLQSQKDSMILDLSALPRVTAADIQVNITTSTQ